MRPPQPIPLTPIQTHPGDAEYQGILSWHFDQTVFFEAQVCRLLQADIPQRILSGSCRMWVFQDPNQDIVGFGTLDVCAEYSRFAHGKQHCYIPLLAVNPAFQRRGHGRTIVQYLIEEAEAISQSPTGISDLLFLDVYTVNQGAIALYQQFGFVELFPGNPLLDPQESNQPYTVMARSVAIAAP